MIDYHEAVREMHKGNVVQCVGTANGPVWKRGASFCMCRAVIFQYYKGEVQWDRVGYMLYDPDFRYELTGETVDPRAWKDIRHIKSELGYSRIGLGNV